MTRSLVGVSLTVLLMYSWALGAYIRSTESPSNEPGFTGPGVVRVAVSGVASSPYGAPPSPCPLRLGTPRY